MKASETGKDDGVYQLDWHAIEVAEVFDIFETSHEGLKETEVEQRRKTFGKNEIKRVRKDTVVMRILTQLRSPLTVVLLLAFAVTLALKEFLDAGVILVALFIAITLSVLQEGRASKAFEKLVGSQTREATVIRDGKKYEIAAAELIPGDVVVLQSGMQVPADVRIFESKQLSINEAPLTGEWMSVEKMPHPVEVGTPLAEMSSMARMGTHVARGHGLGVVIAIGKKTSVGELTQDLTTIQDEATPIQHEIAKISKILVAVIVTLIVLIFIVGLFAGESLEMMLITAIAVAVASIPEGLPAAVTIILAVGMETLLGRGGLVRNLLAAETLGSTTYILTDKTGTLTEAKMAATGFVCVDSSGAQELTEDSCVLRLLDIALCASDGYLEEHKDGEDTYIVRGEPIERAILEAGQTVGVPLSGDSLRGRRIDLLSFESENRFAAGLAPDIFGENTLCFNGAPELLLERSTMVCIEEDQREMRDEDRAYFEAEIRRHTSKGKRLIAVGWKNVSCNEIPDATEGLLENIVFAGLIIFDDPVRKDVKKAMRGVKSAGATVLLVTGDNPETALSVAQRVGIARKNDVAIVGTELEKLNDEELLEVLQKTRVFARVLPKQKMRLARVLQESGEIVAMTGDGINDAPALRKANIGIAIGSGTEVAKESSDLVLVNDNFTTIYAAIEEGRRVIGNLRRTIGYLLATSLTEVTLISGALLTGGVIPILPAQILWANIIEEGLMSVAIAFEPGDKNAMKERPQDIRRDGVFSRTMLKFMAFVVSILGALLLCLYAALRFFDFSIEDIRSVMFLAISIDSLFIAFSFRSLKTPIWNVPLKKNLYFIGSFLISLLLLGVVISVPFLQNVFSYEPLGMVTFLGVFLYGLFSLFVIEIAKWFFIARKR